MSRTVITGNDNAHGSPVAGLMSCGPVVPMQPPSTLAQMMKYRSVSSTLAGADHRLPPARLAGDRMRIGDVLVAGQRVADQDGVGALRVERAVGLIGDRERAEIDPAVEPQRLVARADDGRATPGRVVTAGAARSMSTSRPRRLQGGRPRLVKRGPRFQLGALGRDLR